MNIQIQNIEYSWIFQRIFIWIHEYSNEFFHIHMQIYSCGIEVDLTSPPARLVAHYLSWEHHDQTLLHLQAVLWLLRLLSETSRPGAVGLPLFCQQPETAAKHSTNQVWSGLAALGDLVTIISQWHRGLEACCAPSVSRSKWPFTVAHSAMAVLTLRCNFPPGPQDRQWAGCCRCILPEPNLGLAPPGCNKCACSILWLFPNLNSGVIVWRDCPKIHRPQKIFGYNILYHCKWPPCSRLQLLNIQFLKQNLKKDSAARKKPKVLRSARSESIIEGGKDTMQKDGLQSQSLWDLRRLASNLACRWKLIIGS